MNTMKNMTYSRGAQFKGGKSTFLFFISFAILVTLISLLYNGEHLSALAIFPFLAVALFLTADIQGIEIDLEQNKVREYRLTLLGKKGSWMNFKPFTKISLNQADYNISTADLTTGGRESYEDQHHHFVVEIINPTQNIKLLLAENGDLKKAHKILTEASERLQLEIV